MFIDSIDYSSEDDFTRIMEFLRETYEGKAFLHNHFPTRFENDKDNYPEGIHIWEEMNIGGMETKNRIVGLTIPTRKFIYLVQIHPGYENILNEIVTWIINHSKAVKTDQNKKQELQIIALEGHVSLETVLLTNKFTKGPIEGFLRIRPLDAEIEDLDPPYGFAVRSINGESEYSKYAKAIRETFGHGEWFDEKLVSELNSNSYYNQDLDLIMEAPNGDIASFCTFRMDPISKITELEPMGTVPEYRGLGLGKVLLNKGFKRLNKYSPTLLFIGGAADNPGANKLYDSTSFAIKGTYYRWKRFI